VSAAAFFARWRVRIGYPLAIIILLFARPTPKSIIIGALVGFMGLLVRALAAGHLHKQAVLTMTGPYAYTRNPLYLGSAILSIGAGIAMDSWISAIVLCSYFALFYSIVMRREEGELRLQHGTAFDEYAKAVPLFLPRLTPAKLASAIGPGQFSFAQYRKNREYRATIGFSLLLLVLFAILRLHLAERVSHGVASAACHEATHFQSLSVG
jgi:protein-S-isoprenylcysteine O-methyltransferase Ste14